MNLAITPNAAISGLICFFVSLVSAPLWAQSPEPDITDRLEEIVVTSSRIEMPLRQVATAVSVITRDDIELKGYSSVADLLRTQASIGVSNNGGAGKVTTLRIRGEEGFRTLVLIDGMDVSDPTGVQIGPQIEHLSTSYDIERIEVLRGPQGFLYGADAGGVVNVLTSSGEPGLQGGVSLEAGSFGSLNLGGRASGGNEQVNFALSVTRDSTDGFNSRVSDTGIADDDGAENRTVHFKGNWLINDLWSASLIYRDVDSEADFDNCFTPAFSTSNNCTSEYQQQSGRVEIRYRGANMSHQLSYTENDFERASFTDGGLGFSAEGPSRELEYLGTWDYADNASLVFGADYEEDEITTPGSETERDQLGLFVEAQYEASENLFVTAGFRHDDNSQFGNHLSYRFSGAYLVDLSGGDQLKFRATYGTGFRAPSLSEQAYNDGPFAFGASAGLQLAEENSEGFDIGLDYYFDNGAQVEVTYFDQRIDDQILFDLVGFQGYLQATGETNSRGVEFGLDLPLAENLELTANLTYNDTETSDNLTRIRRPEQLGNLSLQYRVLDNRLRLLGNLRLSRNAENEIFLVGRVPLDDYSVFDLSATYDLNQQTEVFGRIENLFDEDYEEITGFNTADRAAYLGVRYNF